MLRRKVSAPDVIRPVRVYLDDVKVIHDELSGACNEVNYRTDDYQVDSFEDLKAYPTRRIKGLSVSGRDPHVGVNFGDVGAIIHQHTDGLEADGLAHRIRDFLFTRRRPIDRVLTAWPVVLGAMIAGGVIVGALPAAGRSSAALEKLLAAAFFAAAFVVLYGLFTIFYRGSVVISATRGASPSFLKRNADALLVNGFVAAVSATATYLLTR